jgi:diguanylate cyclase (GGDEF)-like protein
MATRDPMTRLINRPELLTRVDRLLSHSPRTGTQMATLFIDLDNLKRINDTYGHSVGDDVIVAVSERLREQVRSGDLVARLGGDEFVVLLPAIHTIADAERIAGKLLAAVGEPLAVESHTLTVTASIGVALASSGDDPDRILEFWIEPSTGQSELAGKDRQLRLEAVRDTGTARTGARIAVRRDAQRRSSTSPTITSDESGDPCDASPAGITSRSSQSSAEPRSAATATAAMARSSPSPKGPSSTSGMRSRGEIT